MRKFSNIMWGLVLIALGVIIGLNSLGLTSIELFFDGWWTLFIIIPCFIGLITDKEKTGSIIGLIIGVLLLLGCQDIISFETFWKLLIPMLLVILGLSMVFKDMFNSKINRKISELNKNSKSEKNVSAYFSGQKVAYSKEEFDGINMEAVFGGIKLDLREAIIKKDVVINARAIFGGIDILVPENINVVVSSSSMFGGVDNKREINQDNKITIYVNDSSLFGGIDIK